MAAPQRSRTRLGLGVATVVLAAGLALAPLASTKVPGPLLLWLGVPAVLLAAGAAWRFSALVPAAVVLLAAEYALSLFRRGAPVDARAPLFAAGLVLLAELAYWSTESHRLVRQDPAVVSYRAAVLAVLALGTMALGALALLAAELPLAGSIARLMLGLAAATATLALIALLTRRESR